MSTRTATQSQNQKMLLSPKCYYKTQLCRAFMEKPNGCPSGWHCGYAHGHHELRIAQVPTYKTKPCHRLFKNGFCQYGERCIFIHPADSISTSTGTTSTRTTVSAFLPVRPLPKPPAVSSFSSSTSSNSVSSSSTPSPTPSSPLSTSSSSEEIFNWSSEGKKPQWLSSWLKEGLACSTDTKVEPLVVENDILLEIVESVLQEEELLTVDGKDEDWSLGLLSMKDKGDGGKLLGARAFGLEVCWFK
ncbi:hypothetical protein RvY_02050 [Ramazzottius varieornatus]|uniref:C3H1-type domain-containing protein n=1 Tax=Ramazzottius varieornatus TaxID=947166 RepID=A0A1D1UM68_RAMVA|nr:hypothetical protein RvY_02050 [Ramazzottius varieornatus]